MFVLKRERVMCFCKKFILLGTLFSMSFSSINCIWPFSSGGSQKADDLPEINVPGYKKGRVIFTRVGRELFQAFLNQKNYDKTEINKIIKENEQSKFYHLYSAYCYGFDEWKKAGDPYQKEKIKRAVWNIAIEFSENSIPQLKSLFLKLTPALLLTGVAVITLVFGAYSQKHCGTASKINQFFAWVKRLFCGS